MTTEAFKSELLNLEKLFWRATQEKDGQTAARLTDEPCIITGPQGVSRLDKQHIAEVMTTAPWTLNEFEIDDNAEVRLINDDVAILAYKVQETVTVDGKPVTLDANAASMWVRRGDSWGCALHTESISGDPFGRDRMPMS